MSEGQTSSPKRVLLTTIGAGKLSALSEVGYEIDGKPLDEKSRFFSYALAKYLGADIQKIIVLLTEKARADRWEPDGGLEAILKRLGPSIVEQTIPDGFSENEIWEIFSHIYTIIEEGSELYIDVTSGFRHLPMIMLAACMYLRRAKNVKIRGIFYGALEAYQEAEKLRPVLDLLPFVTLLDWAEGLDAFKRIGDTKILAGILRSDEASSITRLLASSEDVAELAKALTQFNASIDFGRSLGALIDANQLNQLLEHAQQRILHGRYSPIRDFFGEIKRETVGFAQSSSEDNVKRVLQNQVRMIRWLIEKRQLPTALLMASEWLISLARYKDSDKDFNAVFYGSERKKYLREKKLERYKQIHELYGKIDDLRNDYAHVGNRPDAKNAEILAQDTYTQLESIFDHINFETLEIKPAEKKPTQGQDSQ